MTCDDDKKRMLDLLMKQQEGKITAAEVEELEAYVRTDNVLLILNAKARLALRTAEEGTISCPKSTGYMHCK